MVTRRFDVFDPVVLTVGTFHAGTADNVIPDDAKFSATVRTFSAGDAGRGRGDRAPKLAREIAAAHGLTADGGVRRRLPGDRRTTPTELAFAEQTVAELLGDGRFITAP